jgi:hypothetical protein
VYRFVCPMKEELQMWTSIFVFALAAVSPVVADAQEPTWQTSYTAAQQKASGQRKPLAIVFGQGAKGWQQVGGGTLTSEATRTLADNYVCCYVDTGTSAGQELAREFELTGPVGLVISDRAARLQAFWHQGSLPADALLTSLTRYADPAHVVTATQSNSPFSSTSYYPPSPWYGSAYSRGPVSGGRACRT